MSSNGIGTGVGKFVVVQPLLVASVVFALPLGVRLTGQRVGPREIVGAGAVTAGLACFLAISDPARGRDDAPLHEWLVAGGIVAGVVAALVLASIRRPPAAKAALLGTASGVLFGVVAALTKVDGRPLRRRDRRRRRRLARLRARAVTVVGLVIMQASLQAGALAPSIATIMSFETVVGVAIGILLLDETLDESGWQVAVSLVALLVALGGILLLARSQGELETGPIGAAEPA